MIIGEAHRGQGHVVAPVIAPGFAQDDSEGARLQWRQVAGQLGPKVAKLAALMMDEAEVEASGVFRRHLVTLRSGDAGSAAVLPAFWSSEGDARSRLADAGSAAGEHRASNTFSCYDYLTRAGYNSRVQ